MKEKKKKTERTPGHEQQCSDRGGGEGCARGTAGITGDGKNKIRFLGALRI